MNSPGGVKVDAILYSPMLPSERKGIVYHNLMHVSDWFPSFLDIVGIAYETEELDGVSHLQAWMKSDGSAPRTNLLVNYYKDIATKNYDIWTNGSFAVRNARYKLLHTFESDFYSSWWGSDDHSSGILTDDNLSMDGRCSIDEASSGDFKVSSGHTFYIKV